MNRTDCIKALLELAIEGGYEGDSRTGRLIKKGIVDLKADPIKPDFIYGILKDNNHFCLLGADIECFLLEKAAHKAWWVAVGNSPITSGVYKDRLCETALADDRLAYVAKVYLGVEVTE